MNATQITLLKAISKEEKSQNDLIRTLSIKERQLSEHIKILTDKEYLEEKDGNIKLKNNDKTNALVKLAEKSDIEKVLHESTEDVIPYLTEITTVQNLVRVSGKSQASIYRAIEILNDDPGFVKDKKLEQEKEVVYVGIKLKTALHEFALILRKEQKIDKKTKTDKKKEKTEKLTFEKLKKHLWGAADILRGSLDANEYRQIIMTLLFLKRLNDQFDERREEYRKEGKSEKFLNDPDNYAVKPGFFIPTDGRWKILSDTFENLGQKIDDICSAVEHHQLNSQRLEGVLTNTSYNDKKKFPDDLLLELVSHYNEYRLRNSDLENEDVFGDAYEYLLEQFADSAGKKAGEFFTPREVVKLLVRTLKPEETMSICDPTCGSGGMLIQSAKYVKDNGGNPNNLLLKGQERNYGNYGMCKMNLLLHNVKRYDIQHGDVLKQPLHLTKDGGLGKNDRVIANFPFSMDWNSSNAADDPYGRFKYGIPPSKDKADFAFIQHMIASTNDTGKAAIICSQGILFRGGEERKIREAMIKDDLVEAIIALPQNLFYGTGVPACVLLLNKDKPKERKNKIMIIYAAKDYEDLKKRDKLREKDIEKIISHLDAYRNVYGYCYVANSDELVENKYNTNVPRYVDISKPEKPLDISKEFNLLQTIQTEWSELQQIVLDDKKESNL
jgi:type I restriction enzyme M protein